jgi:Rad3-related DNA helicase
MTYNNLIDAFPPELTPRDGQIKVLKQIENNIGKKKFIILNANTGFGKAAIAKTLGNFSKHPSSKFVNNIKDYSAYKKDVYGKYSNEYTEVFGAFALTITKSLQNQYQRDFPDGEILKGKRNYVCKYDEEYDVESGPCVLSPKLLSECWGCNRCNFYNSRNDTLIHKFGILNYSVFLTLPEHLRHREFLILDEASELEEELVKRFSIAIKYADLDKVGIIHSKIFKDDPDSIRKWITDIHDEVRGKCEYYQESILKKSKTKLQDSIKLKYLKNLFNSLEFVIHNWTQAEFISDCNDDSILIQPYKVNRLSKHIFDYGKTVVLMSATIIDHEHYAESLGISKDEYIYIEADNTFDPQKSPIYSSEKYPMTYNVIDENLPHVCKMVKDICDNHPNDKGLIHTGNFKITQYLKDYLPPGRFLYREDNTKNEDIINLHENAKGATVLVSPSMTHGVDLRGDLGRFQIIMKIPYLPINNKRIKKLMDNDPRWYQNKMLSSLIQGCGRCTRSQDDHSITYVLDGSFKNAIKRNKRKLPEYFLQRLV